MTYDKALVINQHRRLTNAFILSSMLGIYDFAGNGRQYARPSELDP